uniref:UDP-N-acetylglucosamine diphosphorylase 1 n=1 Tax=Tanacetum cinerariifolium TaxID=118510 RepID=A0A699I7H8_TANCI|nr:UDP-N-acetylglucosamine diphosphorylase 1 [Tanacetum cinerariifolium]
MTKPYSSPCFIANCFNAGYLKMEVKRRSVKAKELQKDALLKLFKLSNQKSILGEHAYPVNRGLLVNHLSSPRRRDGKNKKPRNFADTLVTKSCQLQGLLGDEIGSSTAAIESVPESSASAVENTKLEDRKRWWNMGLNATADGKLVVLLLSCIAFIRWGFIHVTSAIKDNEDSPATCSGLRSLYREAKKARKLFISRLRLYS